MTSFQILENSKLGIQFGHILLMVVAQLCPTVCNPMGSVVHQAALSMGLSGQEYWSGLPLPSPRALPHPGIEPASPALQGVSLPTEPTGKHVLNRMI